MKIINMLLGLCHGFCQFDDAERVPMMGHRLTQLPVPVVVLWLTLRWESRGSCAAEPRGGSPLCC
eukprot:2392757-Amphidinium_carterae.1